MALKTLIAAGTLGTDLSALCQTINTLSNQYGGGPSSPLGQILAAFGASGLPDTPENQAAIQTLLSSVVLPTSDQYAAASASRFTTEDSADANAILGWAAVLQYALTKAKASLPLNDI